MRLPGLIILDGSDATGKTTLANHLLDGDTTGYIHLTYDPTWKNPDQTLWRMQYFALIKAALRHSMGLLTVIDRHWPSEQIYARVYRNGSTMDPEARGWDRVVQRLCGVYVLCAPHPASAALRHAETCKSRTEMYKPDGRIESVASRYYDWWHGSPFAEKNDYVGLLTLKGGMKIREDAVLYDIDIHGDHLRMVAQRIFDVMRIRQKTQYAPGLEYKKGNYLGHPKDAKFLFVGERINPNKSGKWPFIDYGASSATLSGILHDLEFDERQAMWTNAYASDTHVLDLVQEYPYLTVIALGNDASKQLEEMNVGHDKVYHPAYAKRFNQIEPLRSQLQDIINVDRPLSPTTR